MKKYWLGILAVILIFGITVIECSNASNLNGTWIAKDVDEDMEWKFHNGNYEILFSDSGSFLKGTYTTDAGKITITMTHLHGNCLDQLFEYREEVYRSFAEVLGGSFAEFSFNFDSKWYTKEEVEKILKDMGSLEYESITGMISIFGFIPFTFDYSISGNSLALSFDGDSVILARKN